MKSTNKPIITLTTDFGLKDWYVGAMKGVIYDICPECIVVDITHNITKFNIQEAMYVLYSISRTYPTYVVHVCVVDPGVGTSRRAIGIKNECGIFIGPDNGVFSLVLRFNPNSKIYEIKNRSFMRSVVSYTFHGRDIFAPVAAHLSRGRRISDVGPEIDDIVKLDNIVYPKLKKNQIECTVLYVDTFGNIITNIHVSDLKPFNLEYGDKIQIVVKDELYVIPYYPAYGYVKQKELLALIGSSNFLEISANMYNANKILNLKLGDKLFLNIEKRS